MKKYDLHCHTSFSDCSFLDPGNLLKKAKEKNLDGIAVTDHNTIEGALKTRSLNKNKNFEVIIGEEVSTDKGHIIGLYLKKKIKPGRYERVIKDIKEQAGIAIIPHPFSKVSIFRKGFVPSDIKRLKKNIDAIETFNSRFFFCFENKKAKKFAEKQGIAQTGGSDSHFSFEVGRAYTIFDKDLITSLKKKETASKGSILLAIPSRCLSLLPVTYNSLKKIFR